MPAGDQRLSDCGEPSISIHPYRGGCVTGQGWCWGVRWTSLHVNYEVPTLSPVHSQKRDSSVCVIFFFKVLTKVTLTFPSLSLNFRQVSSWLKAHDLPFLRALTLETCNANFFLCPLRYKSSATQECPFPRHRSYPFEMQSSRKTLPPSSSVCGRVGA